MLLKMLREERKFSIFFAVCIILAVPLYGVSYSIKSDSMIIYTASGENRTKFFNNIKFNMDNVNFTSQFAEMLGDSVFILSDSVVGRKQNNIYKTDTMYFNQRTSVATFIGNNRFDIDGSVLEGNRFLLNLIDSTLFMTDKVKFKSRNDSIVVNAGRGLIKNREKYAVFYDNPVLNIIRPEDTICVKSDTIIFENDSIARFTNNLTIVMASGEMTGEKGIFNVNSQNGIITGSPQYKSNEVRINGDTVRIVSTKESKNILFYNNAEMEYNKNDSMFVKADSIVIEIESDTIKVMKAFGEVDGSYRRAER